MQCADDRRVRAHLTPCDCLLELIDEADASALPYVLLGHVGDGNFHFGYLVDLQRPEELVKAEQLNAHLLARAIRLGGTCTGEHGIGFRKMSFLQGGRLGRERLQ